MVPSSIRLTIPSGGVSVRRMRTIQAALGVMTLVLAAATLLAVLIPSRYSGPVYAVAEVQAGLQHNPQRWVGRTVLVHGRAIVTHCPGWCPYAPQFLIDAQVPYSPSTYCPPPQSIPIKWTVDPHVAILLQLPLLGPLISPFVRGHLGGVGTYRVQLQRNPAVCNGIPEKYQATLLDGLR